MTIEGILLVAMGLWPRAFSKPEQADAWAGIYRDALGHLSPIALGGAWKRCMASYDGTRPPMPADVLKHVTTLDFGRMDGSVPTANPASAKAMFEALPGIIGELLRDWWANHGTWFFQECDRRGIDEDRRPAVRGALHDGLWKAANYQAQLIFRDPLRPRILDLDIADGYYRRWIDACWHAGKPLKGAKPSVRFSLGAKAREIVADSLQPPSYVTEGPPLEGEMPL